MLFGDNSNKKNILSLYNALYDTNYTDESKIDITTLEDALYVKMKDDVSFLLDNCLSLWEHQSTFNPNMPVRGLMYYGNLYNSYIEERGLPIYGSSLVKLPAPHYIVFYNGTKECEPIKKLRLSDAFIQEDSNQEFEWTATMINLNEGNNEELLSKCKLDRAINECIEENVLADFLRKHRGDVMNSCLTEFSEELYKKGVFEEGRAAGFEEAAIENARNFFKNGVSFDIVRKSIENLSDEQLRKIYEEVMASKLNK